MSYTINEVSKITGISKRELLCYLNRGIVVPQVNEDEKNKITYTYNDEDIVRINQTVMYQKIGYSLSEIENLCKGNLVGEAKKIK